MFENRIKANAPKVKGVGASEKRRRNVEQVNDIVAREHVISGQVPISGSGDAEVEVRFPVYYTQKPLMYFGGEMAENQATALSVFPTISVVVGEWNIEVLDQTETRLAGRHFYVGARLFIVTTGDVDMIAHWHMTGIAITNPTGAITGTTGTDVTL